ncbi:MAG: DUF1343 domain-containing protein [Kiritimatiellae bacterium]|nr:DUF1343 domain-containing protein [Kiritimatiellia bacterium]MDD4341607.1 DUF1343 domain-containing protein [Kiritimatiellia bacterium]
MTTSAPVRPGIESIPREWLADQRVGLVAHPASRTADGRHSAAMLRDSGIELTALFGPEHGFFGHGGAGETLTDSRHPEWDIPIFSLYGETRAPTPAMLEMIDIVIVDLQAIACRAYTYGSTLRLLMEACATHGKTLIVADRPDPLMRSAPDGPMLEADCASFVGLIPTPFCHGMTLGELALFLREELGFDRLDLRVAPCTGLTRHLSVQQLFPTWHAPSPAIVALENALCFPMTVFFEALPMLDHARGTPLAFQCIGSTQVDLTQLVLPPLPGVLVGPCDYPDQTGQRLNGLRLQVTDPAAYRPAAAAIALLNALETLLGPDLWTSADSRPDFYTQLWGARTPAPPWPTFTIPQRLY